MGVAEVAVCGNGGIIRNRAACGIFPDAVYCNCHVVRDIGMFFHFPDGRRVYLYFPQSCALRMDVWQHGDEGLFFQPVDFSKLFRVAKASQFVAEPDYASRQRAANSP